MATSDSVVEFESGVGVGVGVDSGTLVGVGSGVTAGELGPGVGSLIASGMDGTGDAATGIGVETGPVESCAGDVFSASLPLQAVSRSPATRNRRMPNRIVRVFFGETLLSHTMRCRQCLRQQSASQLVPTGLLLMRPSDLGPVAPPHHEQGSATTERHGHHDDEHNQSHIHPTIVGGRHRLLRRCGRGGSRSGGKPWRWARRCT